MLRIGVTGTDTGVGKTVVACAILRLLQARGLRTAAMKPVETGVIRGEGGSDHVLLAQASESDHDSNDVCPVILEDALAPWVASRAANIEISIAALHQSFARLCEEADSIVVEGAGGLLVPITREVRYDHLFALWDLELVIVAADRLGVINHSLLTVEAALRAGLRVRGIVLNQLHPPTPSSQGMNNAAALRELMPDIPLVEFPSVEGFQRIRRLNASREPLDMGLLRDVALGSGLASVLFGVGAPAA